MNVNAPICPLQTNCTNAPRPQPTLGNIYEYESNGFVNQNQLRVNFRTTISTKYSLFGNYGLSFTNSDSDGAGSFPAYTYNLAGEYGRSSSDIRHNFVVGGNITIPWNVSLSPFVTAYRAARSTSREVWTQMATACYRTSHIWRTQSRVRALHLTASFCNIGSNDVNAIIPRNYGQGPNYFSVNLRVGKNIGFGKIGHGGSDDGTPGGRRRR